MSAVEGVFSRGDSSLAPVLEAAYAHGDILTSWQEHFDYSLWQDVLNQHEMDQMTWLGSRAEDETMPWSHINCGIQPAYLLQERKKAWQESITLDCRYHGCSQCGVCTIGQNLGELITQASSRPIRPIVNQRHRDQELSTSPVTVQNETKWGEKKTWLVLEFTKKGPAAYLSQLELQTVLERIFRRADLPLSFSRGFHPMPKISFGRALPVGVHSEAESCLLVLRRPAAATGMCSQLNKVTIPGLQFIRAKERSPGQKLTQPRFEHFILHFHLPEQEAEHCIQAWIRAATVQSWTADRQTKKGIRQVDLRPKIHAVSQSSPNTVGITYDWEPGYLSPLFFVRTINPQLDPRQYTLTKSDSAGNLSK
jgi:radical SAM-linked protein